MKNKKIVIPTMLIVLTACGISGQKEMKKKCSEKITEKYPTIIGVPNVTSMEDTDGLKLAMGKHAETTKTIVTATFSTNSIKDKECTCLFDSENKFLDLLEDTFE